MGEQPYPARDRPPLINVKSGRNGAESPVSAAWLTAKPVLLTNRGQKSGNPNKRFSSLKKVGQEPTRTDVEIVGTVDAVDAPEVRGNRLIGI